MMVSLLWNFLNGDGMEKGCTKERWREETSHILRCSASKIGRNIHFILNSATVVFSNNRISFPYRHDDDDDDKVSSIVVKRHNMSLEFDGGPPYTKPPPPS